MSSVRYLRLDKKAYATLEQCSESLGVSVASVASAGAKMLASAAITERLDSEPTPPVFASRAEENEWMWWNGYMTMGEAEKVLGRGRKAIKENLDSSDYRVHRSSWGGARYFSPMDLENIVRSMKRKRLYGEKQFQRVLWRVNQSFAIQIARRRMMNYEKTPKLSGVHDGGKRAEERGDS